MAHSRFVIHQGELREADEVAAWRQASAILTRSDFPSPIVIRDALDSVVNPCDGKPYDSKRAYYQAVKDHGCVIVGNEAEKMAEAPAYAKPDVKAEDIVDAIHKVESGYKPAPLEYDD